MVRDTVSEDGLLVEDTFDWYAQDADGNVWYLGEETAEFEDGQLASREGSFEAGVDGALPGVVMPADPTAGLEYRQEYYAGEAEDNGAVLATGQQVEVPQGHFDDALLTADTNALEPEVLEYKLYAPDVGLVLTLDVSGGAGPRGAAVHPHGRPGDRPGGRHRAARDAVRVADHYIDPMIDRDRLATLRSDEESRFVELHPRSAALARRPAARCWPAYRCRG